MSSAGFSRHASSSAFSRPWVWRSLFQIATPGLACAWPRSLSHWKNERHADSVRAIDDGAIVLVSLATEGGKIAESDSRLFASLMLTDLWQVAKLRGKQVEEL